MSTNTSIQWTDATWNPIRGCSLVSEGCTNCYAMGVAARFSGPGLAYEGLARRRSNGKPQWTGDVRIMRNLFTDPIRWRKPRRIFVNSMSDLFHEKVDDTTLDELFAVMAIARRHTFQILTKRPERMQAYLSDRNRLESIYENWFSVSGTTPEVAAWPLPNVWLGVSVEHQRAADARIPLLLETPAAVRFLSCEPLLEEIDLTRWSPSPDGFVVQPDGDIRHVDDGAVGVDWVIVGGESGANAREFDLAWARRIVRDCRTVFVKQLGRRPIARNDEHSERWPGSTVPFDEMHQHVHQGELAPLDLIDSHGGDWDEWPEDLKVREFPRAAA